MRIAFEEDLNEDNFEAMQVIKWGRFWCGLFIGWFITIGYDVDYKEDDSDADYSKDGYDADYNEDDELFWHQDDFWKAARS